MIARISIYLDGIAPTLIMTAIVSAIVLHIYFIYLVSTNKNLSFTAGFIWTMLILMLPIWGCLVYWLVEMRRKADKVGMDGFNDSAKR